MTAQRTTSHRCNSSTTSWSARLGPLVRPALLGRGGGHPGGAGTNAEGGAICNLEGLAHAHELHAQRERSDRRGWCIRWQRRRGRIRV